MATIYFLFAFYLIGISATTLYSLQHKNLGISFNPEKLTASFLIMFGNVFSYSIFISFIWFLTSLFLFLLIGIKPFSLEALEIVMMVDITLIRAPFLLLLLSGVAVSIAVIVAYTFRHKKKDRSAI